MAHGVRLQDGADGRLLPVKSPHRDLPDSYVAQSELAGKSGCPFSFRHMLVLNFVGNGNRIGCAVLSGWRVVLKKQ